MRLFWWGVEQFARWERLKLRIRHIIFLLGRSGGIHAEETLWRVVEQRLKEANDMDFRDIPSTEALIELHQGHDFKFKVGQRFYSPIGHAHEIVGYEHKFNDKLRVMWGYSVKNEKTNVVTFWAEGTFERKFKPLVERPARRRAIDL